MSHIFMGTLPMKVNPFLGGFGLGGEEAVHLEHYFCLEIVSVIIPLSSQV